jgi:hypothetical protein
MKAFTIFGLGLALLGTTTMVAVANDRGDRGARREAMRAIAQESFTAADADGNGSLTPEEFQTFHEIMRAKMAEHRFQRADANGDGAVTLDELKAAAPGRRGHHCPGPQS